MPPQSVPPQEQGGQYQQDPNQFETRSPGTRTSRFPSRTGFQPAKPCTASGRPTCWFRPASSTGSAKPLLKLSRMFGAASLMSLRANRAMHIKDCRTANPRGMDYRCSSTVLRRLFGSLAAGQRSLLGFLTRSRGSFYGSRELLSGRKLGADRHDFSNFLFVAIFAIHVLRGLQLLLTARREKFSRVSTTA